MAFKNGFLFFLAGCVILFSCSKEELTAEDHEKKINEWHEDRIERLQARPGWLSLAGMEWLKQGENTFGSGTHNDVIFPGPDMPENAGILTLEDETVTVSFHQPFEVTHEDELFSGGVIYSPEMDEMILQTGSLDWLVIQRSELIGIRIYDRNTPYLTNFSGLELFPIDLKWRIKARFEPNLEPTYIPVTNVLGQTNQMVTPGTLYFEMNGQEYSLAVLPSTNRFFVIVGDESNRTTTYGGGRYLYTDMPDRHGNVIVDFNQLYNPPCAMNPYSTCNLPPLQNRLSLAIEAGEKRYRLPEGLRETKLPGN